MHKDIEYSGLKLKTGIVPIFPYFKLQKVLGEIRCYWGQIFILDK